LTKTQKALLVIAATLATATWLYFLLRPMSWQHLAIKSEVALFEGDAERLRGYFHPEELRALGITEDVAVRAVNEILSPGLDGLSPDRDSRTFSEVDAQYLMSFQFAPSGGSPEKAYIEVTVTEKGPRVLLGLLIGTSWNMVVAREGKGNEAVWRQKLADQQKRLAELGIEGFWHIDTNQIDKWPEN
jgi:hypothetical protein